MKVICIGELLIDFICTDTNHLLDKGVNFIKKAGGAPANVAAAISKLGGQAEFIGKVGNDPFGAFLKQVLEDANVGTKGVILDQAHPTTLAFVSLTDDGERDFVFNRGADGQLALSDLDINIDEAALYHFGSATALLPGLTRNTYLSLMAQCAANGQFVCFDPNYRSALWTDLHSFKQEVHQCLAWANLVKVSEEELALLGESDDKNVALANLHRLGCNSILVTLGKMGTLISHNGTQTIIPSLAITSVDSTGAGDAFIGAVLQQIANDNTTAFEFNQLCTMVEFANKVGALTCTKMGAISALPTLEQIEELN